MSYISLFIESDPSDKLQSKLKKVLEELEKAYSKEYFEKYNKLTEKANECLKNKDFTKATKLLEERKVLDKQNDILFKKTQKFYKNLEESFNKKNSLKHDIKFMKDLLALIT